MCNGRVKDYFEVERPARKTNYTVHTEIATRLDKRQSPRWTYLNGTVRFAASDVDQQAARNNLRDCAVCQVNYLVMGRIWIFAGLGHGKNSLCGDVVMVQIYRSIAPFVDTWFFLGLKFRAFKTHATYTSTLYTAVISKT
jgi:hypothetical protein